MSEATPKLGILVGVDGSAESEIAIRWAAYEAVLRDMPVTLMHAIVPVVVSWPVASLQASFDASQESHARDVIEQAQKTVLASAGESGSPVVHTEVRRAGVATALVDASRDAYMVVVGSRGLGAVGRALLGSVSASLVRHAHCPVAVMRGEQAHARDRTAPVLLGIDGSPASEAATAFAFDEASRRGVDLVALHAWSDVTMFPGMDWRLLEDQSQQILKNVWPAGESNIPTFRCAGASSLTDPPVSSSRNHNMPNWSSSAVVGAAASPECCSGRSAPQSHKSRRRQLSSFVLNAREHASAILPA